VKVAGPWSPGVYDCQFVLVVKLAAVLKRERGSTAASFCGFEGQEVLESLDP